MGYINGIFQLIRDNGIVRGSFMMGSFFAQRFLGIPRKRVYRYYSKKMKRSYLIKYTSDMLRGFDMSEIFGMCPYYSSKSKRIALNLNNKSRVLDIGGFIGDSAVFFGLQGAKVYVFEPQKTAYNLILENMTLNGLKNFEVTNSAVTSDGRDLLIENTNKISDSFDATKNKSGVKLKSLKFSDVLKKEKIWDIVKIDIEGGEWELFEQICQNPKIIGRVKAFVIEIHHIKDNKEMLKRFIELLRRDKFSVELDILGNLGMIWAKRV